MGDLAGLLMALLSGGSLQDVIRRITGVDYGASNDGLQSMIQANLQNAAIRNPLRVSPDILARGASGLVSAMGINPMSGFGQGASAMFGAMYNFAPDIMGSVMGIPNPGQFYRQIANGASGISLASGRGMPSIFNPYSIMDSHDNAMRMAQSIYGLSARMDNGGNLTGYNVDFTHGLNMSEVGFVTQRLLSSDLAYKNYGYTRDKHGVISNVDIAQGGMDNLDLSVDKDGNYINKEDADRFSSNLKKLGGKFNEATSMLAKITGSVEEAFNLMDRIAGGNALGGTAQQATDVANKAMKMASSIRVTAAMSGVSPQEVYARMGGLQSAITARFGMDGVIAQASGLSDLMLDPAYRATMAYSMWEANNPKASPIQKQRMMAGVMARATSYANSSGENLAAIVSANKYLFTDDQLSQIENAYRRGQPNDIMKMVHGVLGPAVYDMMNDPSKVMAARLTGDKDLQNTLAAAGMEGNLQEAERAGARRLYNYSMDRIDQSIWKSTGDSTYLQGERDKASLEELRKMAVENGLTEEGAAELDDNQLRSYLTENGVDSRLIERREKTAQINKQREIIKSKVMSAKEESIARDKLDKAIDASKFSDTKKQELKNQLANGADLGDIYNKVFVTEQSRRENREYIFNGKMSSGEIAPINRDIDEQAKTYAIASTPEEVINAARLIMGRGMAFGSDMVGVIGELSGDKFKDKSDQEKLDYFAEKVIGLEQDGRLSTGGDDSKLTKSYSEGMRSLVKKALGSRIGNLSATGKDGKQNQDYVNLVSNIADSMTKHIKGGKSIGEAYALALGEIDKETMEKIGGDDEEGGRAEIERQIKEAKNHESDLVKNTMNVGQLASAAGTRINRSSRNLRNNAIERLKSLFVDEGISDYDSMETLSKHGGILNAAGAIGKIDDTAIEAGLKGLLSGIGLGNEKDIDIASLAKGIKSDFEKSGKKGNWKASIEKSIDEAVKSGRLSQEKAEEYKRNLTEKGDVGDNVIAAVLDAVKPEAALGQRLKGASASATDSINQVGLNVVASDAGKEIDFNADAGFSDATVKSISAIDSAEAEKNQNRITNWVRAGNDSFAQSEISRTKEMMDKLGAKLKEKGLDSTQIIKGIAGGDTKESQDLESAISELSNGDEDATNFYRGIIKSVKDEKFKVGENEKGGIDLMLEGKSGDLSDSATANITKGAYREGSNSYEILGALAKIVDFIGQVQHNPIPVVLQAVQTNVPVSLSAQ